MNSKRPLCILCWVATSALAVALLAVTTARGETQEKLPEEVSIASLEVQPAQVELTNRFDYSQLLITGKTAEGETVDLTRMVVLEAGSELVDVSPALLVRPRRDGSGKLVFALGNLKAEIAFTVSGADTVPEVSFIRHVQPAFSKMGCNAGTCHGSKDGQDGFKLSLRGYDPIFDHRAFTDDVAARRFNRAAPDQSLMLLKATGTIPHVGGVRTSVGEPAYELVRAWIAAGVKLDLDSPRVAKIEIFPKNPILPRAGLKQQIVVHATYTDGKMRDVTAEAFIESGNIEILEANDSGVVSTMRRGEAPVLVRYEGAYAATTITIMGDRSGYSWMPPAAENYIDQHVYNKLARVKIEPSKLCTDAEFIRRVTLDLTGLPPTAESVKAFLEDARETKVKRDELIDKLIGSQEYIEHWTNKWADMLQVNRKFLGPEGAAALRGWIRGKVENNTPYDQFAREILTAGGSNMENPAAAYWKILREPADAMENTTHLFLAVRFNCNKCHDHPFERWTQDQYYELAGYFAQVGRQEDPKYKDKKIGGSAVEGATPLVEMIVDKKDGEVKHDRTGEVLPPHFPYQHEELAVAAGTRREQLAQWMTSPENQYFAKSYVNRLWGYLFGIGIIEPIDDIRAGNPPTNPELLNTLSEDFIASGFDVRHMMRTICKSRVYQQSFRTNKWNEDDTINYSHALPRRLPAEVLYDAIHAATGAPLKIPGAKPGIRAAELPDVGIDVPFLDDFGRPARESSCECERSSGMVLGPVMKLINGPTVANALADPANALTKLEAELKDDDALVREVFLRYLARYPSQEELALAKESFVSGDEELKLAQAALAEYQATLAEKQAVWEAGLGGPVVWTPLVPKETKSVHGATFTVGEDQSVLVSGNNGKENYTVIAETDLPNITGVRIEALNDTSLPAGGPGRAKNGNFVLSELKLAVAPKADPSKAADASFANASADFSQDSWAVAGAIDGNNTTGWAVSPQFNKPHYAIFETKEDIGAEGGNLLTFSMIQEFPDSTHTLGKFRISVTSSARPLDKSKTPDNIAAVLAVPSAERTPEQLALVANYYQSQDAEFQRLNNDVSRAAALMANQRFTGLQDLAWALINTPAFLFNR